MNTIKNIIKGVFEFMLTNERINTQRCLTKGMDTTGTIIEHKK